MSLPKSVAQLQREHVVMELESIDRMYLNAYVPQLTTPAGVASFLRAYMGNRFASTVQVAPMTEAFVARIKDFAKSNGIEILRFTKGQRKDDVMKEKLRHFSAKEGVVFIGVAQEKLKVPRTERRQSANGGTFPWIYNSTAMVNVYYFYCLDPDFGPFFLKFGSYFPYSAKLCINGHEYLKAQLAKKKIVFEALDNGLLSCEDPAAAQAISDELDSTKIEAFFRKWLRKLPHPFSAKDRQAGFRYNLSVLQAEFSLTQVWNRGVAGRCFFEEVIRENIDLGRPEQVQLIFQRRMRRSTATDGRCRTRIITDGVIPSLHVYYKNTHIKQYHKEGRALRTETTINNTYDFGVGRLLHNLPALREIGFAANRRLLEVEKVSHDCVIGTQAFEDLQSPKTIDEQRVSSMRFGDPRVQALMAVVTLFCLQPEGFRNKQLRPLLAQFLGLDENEMTPGKMSYDLRRLRLRGLIERIDGSHRYRLTDQGLRTAIFYSRLYTRLIRPGLSIINAPDVHEHSPIARAFQRLQKVLNTNIEQAFDL